ncbi:MAG: hypothetical protein DRQ04_01035 [Candidatus Hydrothermota bacterium]|nr:MAG: hypothetical protein DRQ04_01035 [Candidatus Hydrothermae bacterium]
MSEEIKKVLKMVEEGKLSSEEGARLISAIKEREKKEIRGKYLRISIEDGGDRLNIKIPLKLARWAAKFIPEEKGIIQINGKNVSIPFEEVIESLIEDPDELVSIESEDGGRVIIRIE